MATTLTWIYADRIQADPERRHVVKGRTRFAFSDVRRLIADAALSQAELEAQHKRREFIIIQKTALAGAEQRGIEQGIQQGVQQGIQQVARNLLLAGVPPETIAQTTGLSRAELDSLL